MFAADNCHDVGIRKHVAVQHVAFRTVQFPLRETTVGKAEQTAREVLCHFLDHFRAGDDDDDGQNVAVAPEKIEGIISREVRAVKGGFLCLDEVDLLDDGHTAFDGHFVIVGGEQHTRPRIERIHALELFDESVNQDETFRRQFSRFFVTPAASNKEQSFEYHGKSRVEGERAVYCLLITPIALKRQIG